MSDKITLNNNAINSNKGGRSNEIGGSINDNTSHITTVGESKHARCSSLYLNNITYNTIVQEDASAKVNNTNIVYNAKNNIL